ncbi:MAG: hypothetical protein GX790_03475 [Syntrophomonadaceae bacterium]|nr:hypothetical protein [Syntrophomonadaceae bacterium]
MESYSKKKNEELSLRINTQKFSAMPMKNPKKENSIVITTAKKSQVKTKVRCDRCLELINRSDVKHCNECGKNVCISCMQILRGKHYCLACV